MVGLAAFYWLWACPQTPVFQTWACILLHRGCIFLDRGWILLHRATCGCFRSMLLALGLPTGTGFSDLGLDSAAQGLHSLGQGLDSALLGYMSLFWQHVVGSGHNIIIFFLYVFVCVCFVKESVFPFIN